MTKVLIINGPNLNMLGQRESDVYGSETLDDLAKYTSNKFSDDVELIWKQSNIEGEIVEFIHSAVKNNIAGIVINPGAYSHTSVAILDALKILNIPIVETHISNTHRREAFRHVKLTAKASTIIMEGLGKDAYYFAVNALLELFKREQKG